MIPSASTSSRSLSASWNIFALRASEPDEAHRALAAIQDEMLAAYRAQQWDRAEASLAQARAAAPGLATLWDLYAERIAAYRREPPGESWDGVYVAGSK